MKIVGQGSLVEGISKIFEIFVESDAIIRPNFILTGSSGSGKTLLINTLCKKHDIPFIRINAAQITKEGTSGNSLSKCLSPLLQIGDQTKVVCFVDEFDKLFLSGNSNDEIAHETTVGVQNEFLKVLEGDKTSVFGDYGKYIDVNTGKILFIFAGAFNGAKDLNIEKLSKIGIKNEFLGRVGLIFSTTDLSLDDMYAIVDDSNLLSSYCELFDGVDKEQIGYLIKAKLKTIYKTNTVGARVIDNLIHKYFITGSLDDEIKEQKVKPNKKLQL